MRPSTALRCALLLWVTGCGHARIPSLPASHGHLSRAMAHYRDPKAEPELLSSGMGSSLQDLPTNVVVEPGQAQALFQEALQVLAGAPTEQQVRQAAADLSAACDAGLMVACVYQEEQFQRPLRLSGPVPQLTHEALRRSTVSTTVVFGRIGTDGLIRDLRVLEEAPHGLTANFIRVLREWKFQPATLAGKPVEIPYAFQLNTYGQTTDLPQSQELEWARTRVSQSPSSSLAWTHLARTLARYVPEDPQYSEALTTLTRLRPRYWWAATELAWLHAQAGRYAEAEPLARTARQGAPKNPYVLETAALVAFRQGRCPEAVLVQQQAVETLPPEWPREEQERFQRALAEYQRQCPSAAPTASTPPG